MCHTVNVNTYYLIFYKIQHENIQGPIMIQPTPQKSDFKHKAWKILFLKVSKLLVTK